MAAVAEETTAGLADSGVVAPAGEGPAEIIEDINNVKFFAAKKGRTVGDQ